ncbi:unnamed protein product [Bursaphelenchus xylophilus]|uniref:(pine wood nematode) hypothetical protein n=1 Tax=Bursaphelenchus xylophilus TaxID=6326 RepID=A0A7I8XRC4_BURXY|nr:unnamed protein product [Bursaphelenchus xylophilus]CAG9088887.1 unnamed protein product [Bursaphelenchus xylophilus]
MSDCGDTPEIVFRVICFFAIVFNVLFFLLIRYKTPRTMTAYSKVLYTSCIFDGLASISHFLIGNRPLFVKDVLANDFVGPIPRLFAHMEWISDEGYAYFIALEFLFQFSTLSVCFVPCTYRFFHYIRNTTFTRFKFGLLLLVYLIPPFMVAIPFAMLSALVYTPMKGYIGRSGLECTTWFPAIDGRIYKEEQLSSLVDIPYKFGQLLSLFPIFFIYFLIRIFVKLNEDVKKLSSAAGRMQKEITVTLTAQQFPGCNSITLYLVSRILRLLHVWASRRQGGRDATGYLLGHIVHTCKPNRVKLTGQELPTYHLEGGLFREDEGKVRS